MKKILDPKGFSLLETLVAAALLAFSLMGLTVAFAVSVRHLSEGDAATRAYALAQSLIEAKKTCLYADILKDDVDGDGLKETLLRDDGTAPDPVPGDGIYTASRADDGVTRIWTAEPDRPMAGATRILIETRWLDGEGKEHGLSWLVIRHDPAFR